MNLEDLRRHYTLAGLRAGDLSDDPLEQLRLWLDEATRQRPEEWMEPNAMTLATTGAEGGVTARIVLLKGIDHESLSFYTNYDSDKGQHLSANSRAAIVLYWPYLERQVRAEGTVRRLSRELSEAYFRSRPRGSQIAAAISPQSRQIPGRDWLEQQAADLDARLQGAPVPLPDSWGGYQLVCERLEFWQGRENRLHDRFRYERVASQWRRCRLAP